MRRFSLTFLLVFRILFPLALSSILISANTIEVFYNSNNDDYNPNEEEYVVNDPPLFSVNHQEAFSLFLSRIDFRDFLRRAVTPSLLLIIAYVFVVQYLIPWVASLRDQSSDQPDNKLGGASCRRQMTGSKSDRSDIIKSPISCCAEFSSQSTSTTNSPVTSHKKKSTQPNSSLTRFPSISGASEIELDDQVQAFDQNESEGTKTCRRRKEKNENATRGKNRKNKRPLNFKQPNDGSDKINTVAENILIRDQFLALVDSTDTTLHQLLIQLESGKSVILKGIKEFVSSGGLTALKSIIYLILEENRPVEAAALLRLISLDISDSPLQEERERLSGVIVSELINTQQELYGKFRISSTDRQPSVLSCGLNLLFNGKILNSKAPPLTLGVTSCVLDALISRKAEAVSEDFETLKSLIPIPYHPDVSKKMLEIASCQTKNSEDCRQIVSSTIWDTTEVENIIRYLAEIWKTSEDTQTKEAVVNALQFLNEHHPGLFDNQFTDDKLKMIISRSNELKISCSSASSSLRPDAKISSFHSNNKGHDHQKDKNNKSDGSTNWRIKSSNSTDTPLDISQLFTSLEMCLEIIRRYEKRCDRNSALLALDGFENKYCNNKDNEIVPDFAGVALKGLLRIFMEYHDVENAVRIVSLLERLKSSDGESFALVMQLCCRTGKLVKAKELMLKLIQYFAVQLGSEPANEIEESHVDGSELKTPQLSPKQDWCLEQDSTSTILSKALRVYTFTLIDMKQYQEALDFIVNITTEESIKIDSSTITYIFLKLFKSQPDRRIVDRLLSISLDGVDVKGETRKVTEIQNKIRVDENFLAVMVDCCVKFRSDEFLGLIIERYRNDWHSRFTPDVQACGLLIKTLGSCGRLEDCRWIFWHVTETQGIEPSEVTYGCMLDALVTNGRVDEAEILFEGMKAKGNVRPNTIMYSTIVKGYAQEKKLDKALLMHEEMKSRNIPINTVTYNTLVDSCARVGAMDKAAALLDDMLSSGVEPDLITFSTIAKGYCVQGDVERAMQLLTSMKDRDIRPDGILYNSLLDGCVRASRPDLCEQLWQQMKKSGIPPSNFTLTILIKMFGRAGKLNRAFEAVRELPRRFGFTINAHVYTCLMSACIANNEFSKALNVFECMRKDEICADAKTYETVLFGATRWGNFQEAMNIVRDAFSLDRQPLNDKNDHNTRNRFHNNPDPRIVGFCMNTRNFKKLWSTMKEAGEFDMAVPVIEELICNYNSAIHRYIPPEFIRHQFLDQDHQYHQNSLKGNYDTRHRRSN